ncbi:hypothetical protein EVAR_67583_1 [Eumeta japonica]|uniref:Uncharacterized protein n=1 Tax=Eumeta variegata TaxID=151549 RepID=A0A4C2A3C6_EUMVA|nr:hypothetical protein EVAR_67583_1 [Eumeta japonica]
MCGRNSGSRVTRIIPGAESAVTRPPSGAQTNKRDVGRGCVICQRFDLEVFAGTLGDVRRAGVLCDAASRRVALTAVNAVHLGCTR